MHRQFLKIILGGVFIFALSFVSSFAKLPIEYDYFMIDGKSQRLPLAELEIDSVPINKSTVGVDPVTINSRTLVPVRALAEKLGYTVAWLESAQKVTITKADRKIELVIGSKIAYIDEKATNVTDGVAAKIINSSTYVPIRFVTENMGLSIDYDAKLNKINLNSNSADYLIFDKTNSSNVANATKSSNVKPWEPADVERFSVNKPTNTISNQVNTTSSDKEENATTQNSAEKAASNRDKTIYFLNIKTKTGSDSLELSTSGDVQFEYYYISNPKRLIIKTTYSKLKDDNKDEFEKRNKIINADYLDFISAKEDDRSVTLTVYIKEGVNTDDLNISTTGKSLSISKKTTPSNGGEVAQASPIKFDIGRKTGTISIKSKNVKKLPSTSSSIKLEISKEDVDLSSGAIGISNRLIKSATVTQNSGSYTIEIQLQDRVNYNINPQASSTSISLVKVDRQKPLIFLDPGHGGKDSGAINSGLDLDEKTLNLQIALKLGDELISRGYDVSYSRKSDVFVGLNQIANISNSKDPDVFISIHHNSATSSAPVGIETYYYKYSSDSMPLAKSIYDQLISKTGSVGRGVKTAPFVVIKNTESPATLLELGFISNNDEAKKLSDSQYQHTLAVAIADGIDDYFNR